MIINQSKLKSLTDDEGELIVWNLNQRVDAGAILAQQELELTRQIELLLNLLDECQILLLQCCSGHDLLQLRPIHEHILQRVMRLGLQHDDDLLPNLLVGFFLQLLEMLEPVHLRF